MRQFLVPVAVAVMLVPLAMATALLQGCTVVRVATKVATAPIRYTAHQVGKARAEQRGEERAQKRYEKEAAERAAPPQHIAPQR